MLTVSHKIKLTVIAEYFPVEVERALESRANLESTTSKVIFFYFVPKKNI